MVISGITRTQYDPKCPKRSTHETSQESQSKNLFQLTMSYAVSLPIPPCITHICVIYLALLACLFGCPAHCLFAAVTSIAPPCPAQEKDAYIRACKRSGCQRLLSDIARVSCCCCQMLPFIVGSLRFSPTVNSRVGHSETSDGDSHTNYLFPSLPESRAIYIEHLWQRLQLCEFTSGNI